MTKEELEKLIKKDENPKLDFKQEWYWNKNTPKKQKQEQQGELVRDLIALANGSPAFVGETAYLIIGVIDNSREFYSFDRSVIEPFDKFKQQLVDLVNNYAQPKIIDLDMNLTEKVLIISIKPQESIIHIFKDLQVKNRTIDGGTTFFRVGESNSVASPDIIEKFKKAINKYKENKPKAEQLISSEKFYLQREIDDKNSLYKNQKNRISLSASLPIVNEDKSSFSIECEITFILENSIKLLITISEKEILNSLFSGYKSKNYQYARNWVLYFDEESQLYTIEISSSRVNVSFETVKILSEILDDLQEVYALKLNSIEERLKSKSFPFSNEYETGFELCRIDLRLWNDIQKFVSKYDEMKGDDKWNIFGHSLHELVIWDKWDINKVFQYKVDNSSFNMITNPSIIIIWDTLYSNSMSDSLVSVNESYNWFVDELIPQVIKEIHQEEKIDNKSSWFTKKVSNSKLDKKYYFDINDFKEEDDDTLLGIGVRLGNFFFENRASVSRNILRDLYEGLILLFENSEEINYQYLLGKFTLIGNENKVSINIENRLNLDNKEDFLTYIKEELEEIEKDEMSIDDLVSEHTIDYILRCYNAIISDNFYSYSDIFIYDIEEKLKGILEIYDVMRVRYRRLKCL